MTTIKNPSPLPTPPPSGMGSMATIYFCDSNTKTLSDGGTVLECAEKAGLQLDYGCRQGVCGLCKVVKRKGNLKELYDDSALTDMERKQGYILVCVAKADGDIEIKA